MQHSEAVQAKQESEAATARAEQARRLVERRDEALEKLVRTNEAARLKLDALREDPSVLDHTLQPAALATDIDFRVRATLLSYKDPQGRDLYRVELFPSPSTSESALAELALITYRTSHPTFRNTIMAAGKERNFTVTYVGWGCISQVFAILEYVDPERPPRIAKFNMCDHWLNPAEK